MLIENNVQKKILLAHPFRQHSYRVATALKHHDMLFRYVTTVYNKESSLLMRLCKLVLTGDSYNRAVKRRCPDVVDSEVLQFCEIEGLLFLAVIRLDRTKRLANWMTNHIAERFQKKLAKYIIKNRQHIGAVICYDMCSLTLNRILEKEAPEIVRIIDDAHPCRNYLHEIYKDLRESSGEFVKTFYEDFINDVERAKHYGLEARSANYHIVASSFSRKAVEFNGFSDDRIIYAPYGVNSDTFRPLKKDDSSKIKVLFVGEVNQRKGIRQILESAKALSSYNMEFVIVGRGGEVASELYEPYKPYVRFLGLVPFEILQYEMGTSDIFVFPTLGEGFGLALMEAMSAGLVPISSKNCGGADLITDGENGYLVDAGSTEQLVEKILLCYNNRNKLKNMGSMARESVLELTWQKYELSLISSLKNILQ